MTFDLNEIRLLIQLLFYACALLGVIIFAIYKVIIIIKKKANGENVDVEIDQLIDTLGGTLAKTYEKICKKNGVTADNTVVTEIMKAASSALLKPSTQMDKTNSKEIK